VIDSAQRFSRDAMGHGRNLDRLADVVDEDEQERERQEGQGNRERHADRGDEDCLRLPRPSRLADGGEDNDTVGEDAYERPGDNLRDAVLHEAVHGARRVLAGDELESDDRDGKDEADDGGE